MEIYYCVECGKQFVDPTMTCDVCGGWCDHDELYDNDMDIKKEGEGKCKNCGIEIPKWVEEDFQGYCEECYVEIFGYESHEEYPPESFGK